VIVSLRALCTPSDRSCCLLPTMVLTLAAFSRAGGFFLICFLELSGDYSRVFSSEGPPCF